MKNQTTLNKTTDGKFDILKFILSLSIVALHTKIFPVILFPWLRLSVPLFFITTGYFLFRKINSTIDPKEKTKALISFVKRNLQLYSFWFVTLLPLTLLLKRKKYFQNDVLINLHNFFKNLFFGDTFTASWYIIASIIGAVIIFYVSKKINTRILFALSSVLYILLTVISSYSFLFNQENISTLINYSISIINPFTSFPVSIFWLMCGKCFAEKTFDFRKLTYIIITVSSVVLFYCEWLFVKNITGEYKNDAYFFMSLLCIGFFGWFINLPAINFSKSIRLRRFSVVLYAMHGNFTKILLLLTVNLTGQEYNLIVFISVILLCAVTYAIIELLLRLSEKIKVFSLLKYSY